MEMKRNQAETPLYNKLVEWTSNKPVSFHVPGHKNGTLFPEHAQELFTSILSIDMTELPSLDDLHAPDGVIAEAESLAADHFKSDHTFFLVGGSTVGNLAMILSVCGQGDKMIVQRNCHKSVMNGLELALAQPAFVAPRYDETVDRYTNPTIKSLKHAIDNHPDAKGIILTYPDYFGKTYDIKAIINYAHTRGIPVLVDEAHGVHFSLGEPFPISALDLGADLVVQSAHKMAPSMTMGSYLHMKTSLISKQKVSHYLQMLQSSSPSYPLMASLDIARAFLATTSHEEIGTILRSVHKVRGILCGIDLWHVLPVKTGDDPIKITLQTETGLSGFEVAKAFEEQHIYPEFATHTQVLLIHGLGQFQEMDHLQISVEKVAEQLKKTDNHATIEIGNLFPHKVGKLAMEYKRMNKQETFRIPLEEAVGEIAAEAIIPYPPGIPMVLRGEKITASHLVTIKQLVRQGGRIQLADIDRGIQVFKIRVQK